MWALVFVLLALLGSVLVALHIIVGLLRHSHDACIGRVQSSISNKHGAEILRYAAEKYDTVSEESVRRRLAQKADFQTPLTPLWLRDLAERMES